MAGICVGNIAVFDFGDDKEKVNVFAKLQVTTKIGDNMPVKNGLLTLFVEELYADGSLNTNPSCFQTDIETVVSVASDNTVTEFGPFTEKTDIRFTCELEDGEKLTGVFSIKFNSILSRVK